MAKVSGRITERISEAAADVIQEVETRILANEGRKAMKAKAGRAKHTTRKAAKAALVVGAVPSVAASHLGAQGWPFLFLDLLQVAMDRGFGAAAQLFAHRIDGRIAPCGQQFIAGTQHFRLVDSGSGHGSPRYFVL